MSATSRMRLRGRDLKSRMVAGVGVWAAGISNGTIVMSIEGGEQ